MPSSVINSDDGVISGTSGLKSSGGDDGNLVFQSKGTETARINTDKQIVAAAGTALLPALTTTGDVNTGIFFPAADTIAFAEGGAEAMRIDSSGNLAIGATSASFGAGSGVELVRSGTATFRATSGGQGVEYRNNAGTAEIDTRGAFPIVLLTNQTERMRIDSSGNLLVGTTTSRDKLTVAGGVRVGSTAATTGISANTAGLDIVCGSGSYSIVCYDDNNLSTANFSVSRTGALSKASGSFKISHPLPEKSKTHYLVHSFVEAPQADNIYRGKVELVAGRAEVNIDSVAGMTEGTFVALNREVQCFTSNESDWDAVRGSVNGNILTIECQNAESTATISWLVIGERKDQHMYDTDWTDENGKVIVEPLKESTENSEAVPGNE
jgi:hypothetical protein